MTQRPPSCALGAVLVLAALVAAVVLLSWPPSCEGPEPEREPAPVVAQRRGLAIVGVWNPHGSGDVIFTDLQGLELVYENESNETRRRAIEGSLAIPFVRLGSGRESWRVCRAGESSGLEFVRSRRFNTYIVSASESAR